MWSCHANINKNNVVSCRNGYVVSVLSLSKPLYVINKSLIHFNVHVQDCINDYIIIIFSYTLVVVDIKLMTLLSDNNASYVLAVKLLLCWDINQYIIWLLLICNNLSLSPLSFFFSPPPLLPQSKSNILFYFTVTTDSGSSALIPVLIPLIIILLLAAVVVAVWYIKKRKGR